MTRPLLCSKEKSKKKFNPFTYSIVLYGLEIHSLSIDMTKKNTKSKFKYIANIG